MAKRILIVEDDHDLLLQLSDFLNEFGFDTAVADNGIRAIAILDAISEVGDDLLPAVILLDLHMPEMDGWQLRDTLKKHPRYGKIPIIVMSGDTASADVDLHKPLDIEKLMSALKSS